MKALIVYSSKRGATKECVKYITKQLRHKADIVNIEKDKPENIKSYDVVILGSSVYAGRLGKGLVRFYKENMSELYSKKLYLFLCCLDQDGKERYISDNFGPGEQEHFTDVVFCGGILNMNKLNVMERFLMKIILKKKKDESGNPVQVKKDTVLDTRDFKAMDCLAKEIR